MYELPGTEAHCVPAFQHLRRLPASPEQLLQQAQRLRQAQRLASKARCPATLQHRSTMPLNSPGQLTICDWVVAPPITLWLDGLHKERGHLHSAVHHTHQVGMHSSNDVCKLGAQHGQPEGPPGATRVIGFLRSLWPCLPHTPLAPVPTLHGKRLHSSPASLLDGPLTNCLPQTRAPLPTCLPHAHAPLPTRLPHT